LVAGVATRQILRPILTEVHGDPINPGRELRVAPKLIDRLEDLHEDFLRQVLGLVAAPEHAKDQREHPPLIEDDELREGSLIARHQPRDELRLGIFVQSPAALRRLR
jgi:hypothetical protein